MRNVQIKGDKQLEEFKSSVEVMSEKFDECKKDRKEKEKIINGLQSYVSSLKERIDLLEKKNLMIVSSIPAETVYWYMELKNRNRKILIILS